MKEINLREYYPELYNEDSVISVSDEIAEMMRRSILEEKAYQRRFNSLRHKILQFAQKL